MKHIRSSRFSKFIACYLAMMIVLEIIQPMQMYALSSGPSQPEFNSFTPLETSDMVDLTSGNFNYNIPIMDVGGYPLNLSYSSGITMDQEASWTGLGWNLNVGQIQRQVRGLPDDFNGDAMRYENDVKDNVTVGANFNVQAALFGLDAPVALNHGLGVQYNNYEGITFKPSFGVSFGLSENIAVGANFSSSVGEGASVSPSISISKKMDVYNSNVGLNGSFGVDYNSRRGLENMNISAGFKTQENGYDSEYGINEGIGGSISFNTQTFTPTKRVAYENRNFTFNTAIGVEVYGVEFQGQVTGYASEQKISPSYNDRMIKAYGYENSAAKGTGEGVMDFNRENERTVTKNTNVLPISNYTYDVYSIDGQGVSGMFRPFRSQVTYLNNDEVNDYGGGVSIGVEMGAASLVHVGLNFQVAPSTSRTGKWVTDNNALGRFSEKTTDKNSLFYEPVTFKLVGELNVDPDSGIYNEELHTNKPIRLKLDKSRYNNKTTTAYEVKEAGPASTTITYPATPIDGKIKKENRFRKNQVVQKITDAEAAADKFIIRNINAKAHHTAGIKVLQTDGSTYVYGQPVYNIKKVESTFDVSKKSGTVNDSSGVVTGLASSPGNHSAYSDKFLNKITTPAYAHSFLMTSVLSSDYEDITGDGPSADDLGTYTKFDYETKSNSYKWRVPYKSSEASYNEGLKSHNDDEKGNYIYGEKQLTYLKRIITKTHVAFFELHQRQDARGASGEIGVQNNSVAGHMYRLDKITLYNLKDAQAALLLDGTAANDLPCTPIKTAHFKYSYKLCRKTPNNFGDEDGKLTLEKLYFTYKDSNMGAYTPYVFNYDLVYDSPEDTNNPEYNAKSFDIWGNYKPNSTAVGTLISNPLTTSEFPYVKQDKATADKYANAWVLQSIKLPSGGTMTIHSESDEYKYVQNRKAMQMFKVVGAGTENSITDGVFQTKLYDGGVHRKYLFAELGNSSDTLQFEGPGRPLQNLEDLTRDLFISKYLSEQTNKPIYFRFLVNMVANSTSQYDYVTGYFELEKTRLDSIRIIGPLNGKMYVALPVKMLKREGGLDGDSKVNPIAKAGWGFGRTYLNRVVYSMGGNSANDDLQSIVEDLVGSIAAISELWKGPNKQLQDKGCAKNFKGDKSWVRLENPNGRKLGGGLRVKSVELSDNWKVMSGHSDEIYNQKYGQKYNYNLPDGTSSGVATFEPNASAENPFVEPVYPKSGNYGDRIVAPRDQNYVEKPFGKDFFPASRVTYSKVTVTSLPRTKTEELTQVKVTQHATGKVVTEHFTSRDFPTLVDYTDVSMAYDERDPVLAFLDIVAIDHLVATQGFAIETNDMDGKTKSQKVYAEDALDPATGIEKETSGVTYKYNVDAQGKLDNTLTTIDSDGTVGESLVGVDYDMINDFNESKSQSGTLGMDGNVAAMIFGIFPFVMPTIFPRVSYHENILRTAVTTKVTHRTGILQEKIVYYLGASVSTKNLAWDNHTGQVLLTEVTNEYNDKYYNMNFPAYWHYADMGMAYENIDIRGVLRHESTGTGVRPFSFPSSYGITDISTIFRLGDELIFSKTISGELALQDFNVTDRPVFDPVTDPAGFTRAWVVKLTNTKVYLMNRTGGYLDPCNNEIGDLPFRIVRSGKRNLQSAGMASVTLMTNPISSGILKLDFTYEGSGNNPRIINASAVEYKDFWRGQEETGPFYPKFGSNPESHIEIDEDGNLEPAEYPWMHINPYVYNIKGDWRAERSHAYLTARTPAGRSARNTGFFKAYHPFYKLDDSNKWVKNSAQASKWTAASSVTAYNPFGMEIENKDALDRYSSAQYGYNHTLPTAVASNSMYQEMGFENFEEIAGTSRFRFLPQSGLVDDLFVGNDVAHTGRKSVRVVPGTYVHMSKKLKERWKRTKYPEPVCSQDQTTDDYPGCASFVEKSVAFTSGYYKFQITPDFGDDLAATSPQIAVTFSNGAGYSYDSGTNKIKYDSTSIPHPTSVILRDTDGDCSNFDITITPPYAGSSEPFYFDIHGCNTGIGDCD